MYFRSSFLPKFESLFSRSLLGASSFSPSNHLPVSQSFSVTAAPGQLRLKKPLVAMSIAPRAGTHFIRSPFYFLYDLAPLRRPLGDLLSTEKFFTSSFNYLVFPDATAIKTAIFRRLNRQRFLAQRRARRVRALVPFSRKNLLQDRSWQSTTRRPLAPSFSTASSLDFSRIWSFRNALEKRVEGQRYPMRIKRIRFKPGYGRIWRTARKSVQELTGIYARYQYRLTPKLHEKYLAERRCYVHHSSLTVGFAMLTSHFVPDH